MTETTHPFRNDGAGCCMTCEDPPGVGQHAAIGAAEAYAHPWGEGAEIPEVKSLVGSHRNAVVDVVTELARHIELGYDAAHDDKMGPAHLMREGHWRLGHMGEVASPEDVRHGLVVVASLMIAAVKCLDRAQGEIEGTPKLKGYL